MKILLHLKVLTVAVISVLVLEICGATNAWAVEEFDQDITPNAIFGSGNFNGNFTTDRQNGIELGLRAKLRFNEDNLPENTFNSNGTYSFAVGKAPSGFV